MTDQAELSGYIDIWWQAVDDLTTLLEELSAEEWLTPTDLAGWDVRAVVAHIAHLEAILAGGPEESAEVGEPAHVTGPMGLYTEVGVLTRRDRTPDELITEVRSVATARHTALLADPPTDGDAPAEPCFGGVGWTWRLMLRNRPLDVWMHEQDVRRAVGRPGNLDSPAARHTADYLAQSLGFVLAKRVGAPAGTTAVLEVEGHEPVAFEVDEGGRGRPVAMPADPTVRLRTDRETFTVVAGGRRAAEPGAISIEGDQGLGQRIVEMLAVTP